jgi:hypothetical protein
MNAINTDSWEDFEQKLKKLRTENDSESSPLLFRGQGNSTWPLTTTLDRYTKNGMTLLGYYNLITGSIGPEVQTFSGVDVPERRQDVAKSFFDKGLMFAFPSQFPDAPLYGYMAYRITQAAPLAPFIEGIILEAAKRLPASWCGFASCTSRVDGRKSY